MICFRRTGVRSDNLWTVHGNVDTSVALVEHIAHGLRHLSTDPSEPDFELVGFSTVRAILRNSSMK
jgi:hypothetical protein